MGNANPKYHIKTKSLNALSEDAWFNLRTKWNNIPDSQFNLAVFTDIILLSYETAVSSYIFI